MKAVALLPTLLLATPIFALTQTPEVQERVYSDETGKERARTKETVIGFNDPSMSEESLLPSPDGKSYAIMMMASDGIAIVENNRKGRTFEGIAADSLVYSNGAEHFAYVGTLPGKQCVVLDGQIFEYQGISQAGIVFSPDGVRYGWVGESNRGQVAVIDGQQSPVYEGVAPFGVLFSPDSLRSAYGATLEGKSFVVMDGQKSRSFDKVLDLRFTPGNVLVYIGQDGKRENEEWFAVIDDRVHGPYDELMITNRGNARAPRLEVFFVSQNGARAAFAGRRGEEWFAVIGEEEYGPFKTLNSLAISPDGSQLAVMASNEDGWYMAINGEQRFNRVPDSLSFGPKGERLGLVVRKGNKRRAVIDGVEGKPFERIEAPGVRFSPDGTRTAYVGMLGGEKFVVIDGERGEAFRRFGKTPLGFIPGTSHTIYSTRDRGRECLVIDGVKSKPYKSYRKLVFSEDGSRHAYAAEKAENKWLVVIDGVEYGRGGPNGDESRPFDMVPKGSPIISPDGKRVAWTAIGEGAWFVYVDGERSRGYEVVMGTTLSFSPDSKHLAYAAQIDDKKLIVVDGFELDNDWEGFLLKSEFVWEDGRNFSIRGIKNPRFLLIEIELL